MCKTRHIFWQVDTLTTLDKLKSFFPLKRYIAYNLIKDEHRLVNIYVTEGSGVDNDH